MSGCPVGKQLNEQVDVIGVVLLPGLWSRLRSLWDTFRDFQSFAMMNCTTNYQFKLTEAAGSLTM